MTGCNHYKYGENLEENGLIRRMATFELWPFAVSDFFELLIKIQISEWPVFLIHMRSKNRLYFGRKSASFEGHL